MPRGGWNVFSPRGTAGLCTNTPSSLRTQSPTAMGSRWCRPNSQALRSLLVFIHIHPSAGLRAKSFTPALMYLVPLLVWRGYDCCTVPLYSLFRVNKRITRFALPAPLVSSLSLSVCLSFCRLWEPTLRRPWPCMPRSKKPQSACSLSVSV